jgi:hypothetical protein
MGVPESNANKTVEKNIEILFLKKFIEIRKKAATDSIPAKRDANLTEN